jgi:hypothetical protein
MITTIFSKSRPFNYILICVLLLFCFVINQNNTTTSLYFSNLYVEKFTLLLLLVGSLFLSNFICKKNLLTKNNTFVFLFFFSFLILLPESIRESKIIIANFFVLLALRRIVSLQSLITPKQKIFDASLLIFGASLFHFWCILVVIVVFFSIILHVSRDYTNWVLPYIALFTIIITAFLLATIQNFDLVQHVIEESTISLNFIYFSNKYQNIALSIYAALVAFFVLNMIISLTNRPLSVQSSYKKLILSAVIGIGIFLISPNKNNGYLIYSFMPMALMATVYFENEKTKWKAETTAIIIIGLCFLLFGLQI